MAKLTGQTIADSYDQLLIVDAANGISGSLQAIEAGDTGGSASSLKISTSKCEVIPASNSTSLFEVSQADGTAVLSVDTTNARVGIGTAAPEAALHVKTTGGTAWDSTGASGNSYSQFSVVLGNENNTINSFSGIAFDASTERDADSIGAGIMAICRDTDATVHNTDLAFATNLTGDGGLTERVRITGSGKVGIGTATPAYLLDLGGASAPVLSFSSTEGSIDNGDLIAHMVFRGRDADTYAIGAEIRCYGDDQWGDLSADDDDAPTRMQFYTQSNGNTDALAAPRMTIDSTGHVGIGTAAPDKSAYGSDYTVLSIAGADVDNPSKGGVLEFISLGDDTDDQTIGIISAWCDENTGSGDLHKEVARIHFKTNGSTAGEYGGRIDFDVKADDETSLGTAMTINDDRNVGIGTTGPAEKLTVEGNFQVSGGGYECYSKTGDAGSGTTHLFWEFNRTDDANCGEIRKNGSLAVAYSESSDYRVKSNITPIIDGLIRVNRLKPSRFLMDGDTERRDGFIAHEAQEVVPEAVGGVKDEMKDVEYEVSPAVYEGEVLKAEAVMGVKSVPKLQSIDTAKLMGIVVASIQELSAKVDALENNNQTGDSNNDEGNQGNNNAGEPSSESAGEDSGGTEGSSSDSSSSSDGESASSEPSSDDGNQGSGSSGSDASDDSAEGSGGDDS